MREILGVDKSAETFNFGLYGNPIEVLKDYERYKQHHILPFEGGGRNQPQWFWDNVQWLDLFHEFIKLDKKHGPQVLPDKGGSPAVKLLRRMTPK